MLGMAGGALSYCARSAKGVTIRATGSEKMAATLGLLSPLLLLLLLLAALLAEGCPTSAVRSLMPS
jgi:hypothetical protein